MLKSINPHNNTLLNQYPLDSSSNIEMKVQTAHKQYLNWKQKKLFERVELVNKLRDQLSINKNNIGTLISQEMGKSIHESFSEIEKCMSLCQFYIDNAESFLKKDIIKTEYSLSEVHFTTTGIILGIMPWNFPLWQVFRFAIPNLIAGNVVLLKHASNVTGCSLAIEKLFLQSGFPIGCFTSLLTPSSQMSKVIQHDLICGVAFTGSTNAGREVAKLSGQSLKKTVLELGGSDAYLVLKDANLQETVNECVKARMLNCGQSCISPKRIIVHKDIKDEFEQSLIHAVEKIVIGDPLDLKTQIGPMASSLFRDELHQKIQTSIHAGATLLYGEDEISFANAYYKPTILSDITPSMLPFKEEFFGPIFAITEFKLEEEAIDLANKSQFGLGGAIFTQDIEKAQAIAINHFDAGSIFINHFVKSHPALPFGGIKDSGYGRELSSYGLKEFLNIKTITVK